MKPFKTSLGSVASKEEACVSRSGGIEMLFHEEIPLPFIECELFEKEKTKEHLLTQFKALHQAMQAKNMERIQHYRCDILVKQFMHEFDAHMQTASEYFKNIALAAARCTPKGKRSQYLTDKTPIVEYTICLLGVALYINYKDVKNSRYLSLYLSRLRLKNIDIATIFQESHIADITGLDIDTFTKNAGEMIMSSIGSLATAIKKKNPDDAENEKLIKVHSEIIINNLWLSYKCIIRSQLFYILSEIFYAGITLLDLKKIFPSSSWITDYSEFIKDICKYDNIEYSIWMLMCGDALETFTKIKKSNYTEFITVLSGAIKSVNTRFELRNSLTCDMKQYLEKHHGYTKQELHQKSESLFLLYYIYLEYCCEEVTQMDKKTITDAFHQCLSIMKASNINLHTAIQACKFHDERLSNPSVKNHVHTKKSKGKKHRNKKKKVKKIKGNYDKLNEMLISLYSDEDEAVLIEDIKLKTHASRDQKTKKKRERTKTPKSSHSKESEVQSRDRGRVGTEIKSKSMKPDDKASNQTITSSEIDCLTRKKPAGLTGEQRLSTDVELKNDDWVAVTRRKRNQSRKIKSKKKYSMKKNKKHLRAVKATTDNTISDTHMKNLNVHALEYVPQRAGTTLYHRSPQHAVLFAICNEIQVKLQPLRLQCWLTGSQAQSLYFYQRMTPSSDFDYVLMLPDGFSEENVTELLDTFHNNQFSNSDIPDSVKFELKGMIVGSQKIKTYLIGCTLETILSESRNIDILLVPSHYKIDCGPSDKVCYNILTREFKTQNRSYISWTTETIRWNSTDPSLELGVFELAVIVKAIINKIINNSGAVNQDTPLFHHNQHIQSLSDLLLQKTTGRLNQQLISSTKRILHQRSMKQEFEKIITILKERSLITRKKQGAATSQWPRLMTKGPIASECCVHQPKTNIQKSNPHSP